MNEMEKQAQAALEKQDVENENRESGVEAAPGEHNIDIPNNMSGIEASIPAGSAEISTAESMVAASGVDMQDPVMDSDITIKNNATDNGLVENEQRTDTSTPENDPSALDAEKGSRSTRGEDDAAAVAAFERGSFTQGVENIESNPNAFEIPDNNQEDTANPEDYTYREESTEESSEKMENAPIGEQIENQNQDSSAPIETAPLESGNSQEDKGFSDTVSENADIGVDKPDSNISTEESSLPEEAVKPETETNDTGISIDATDHSIDEISAQNADFAPTQFENDQNLPESGLNDFDYANTGGQDELPDQQPETNPSDTEIEAVDSSIYDQSSSDSTDNAISQNADFEPSDTTPTETNIEMPANEDSADRISMSDTEKNANDNINQGSEGSTGSSDGGSSDGGELNQRASESEPNEQSGQTVANDVVDQGSVKDDITISSAQSDLSAETGPSSEVNQDSVEGEVGRAETDSDFEGKGNGSSLADTVSASVVDMIQGINDASLEDNFEKLTSMFEGTDEPCTVEGYSDIIGDTLDECRDLLDSTDDTVSLSPDAYENAIDQWNEFNADNDLVDIDRNDFDYESNNDVEIENDDEEVGSSDPVGIEDLIDDYL